MENLSEYKQGRKVLRNMQDFAREQSSDLRDSMQKDYDEHGSRQLGQQPGNKTGSNSPASKSPSVGSDRNGQQHLRGQATPKSASNNGSTTSAPRDTHSRQRGQPASEVSRQQAARKPEDASNKSRADSSPLPQKQTMPPPVRHVQPHKPSTTVPGVSEASEAPHAHQNSPLPGPPRRTSSGPGGGQLPTAQPKSIPRTTTVKPPDGRPLPSGSSSSSSSGRSSGSTHSASSADARRHRIRDEEEQKDLPRRRSDSPDKNRPPRPQNGRPDEPQKKRSVFGRFGMGKRKDGHLGDD